MQLHTNKKQCSDNTDRSMISETTMLESTESTDVYMCDLCGSKFISSDELSVHRMLNHRTESAKMIPTLSSPTDDYECEWCHKQFSDKNLLLLHMQIHTG